MPFDIAHSSIGQRRRRANAVQVGIRRHRHRIPDRTEQRQVGVGVRVGIGQLQVDTLRRGVAAKPRRSRLADERRAGHEAGIPAFVVHLEVGADHHVEQRIERPEERVRGGGEQQRPVSGRSMLPDPADRSRDSPSRA